MKNTTLMTLGAVALCALPVAAQTQYNSRVEVVMASGRYKAPICPLKGGTFRTSSAGTYLKTAMEGFTDQSGARSAVDSKRYMDGVNKAKAAAGEEAAANPESAAAWYYLGRADLQLGDLVGADSSFTRLEKLSPDCAEEIKGLRQQAWFALVNPSTDFLKKSQFDSAVIILNAANTIARYYPQAYYNMAAAYNGLDQPDSSIHYFKLARERAAADPSAPTSGSTVKDATYYIASLYQMKKDDADAIPEYRKYLEIDPTGERATSVKRALAAALRSTGDAAGAASIEKDLMSAGALGTTDMMTMGARAFHDSNYSAAADAFQKVLATDPINHDALYDLANTYYVLKDGKNLILTAQKLLEIDPLNLSNVKLLSNGYRLVGDQDKQIEVVTKLLGMTLAVQVDQFVPRKDGAKLVGSAIGNAGVNSSDKAIPPTASTLVFEFLNAQGTVVATQEVPVAALAPDAKQAINIDVSGAGITDWRYRLK